MMSHKERRKEKKRIKTGGVADEGGSGLDLGFVAAEATKRKFKEHLQPSKNKRHKKDDEPKDQDAGAGPQRKAQALGAWNPKATLVKGAKMDASGSTSLLLFYQYIQPLWSEVST